MRHQWSVRIVAFVLFVFIFVGGFGAAVWQLWNLLMPKLFGVPRVGFWDAVGLLSLSWILFGSWRGVPWGFRRGHGRMRERWSRMSPEQREQFRKGMRTRCGKQVEGGSSSASNV